MPLEIHWRTGLWREAIGCCEPFVSSIVPLQWPRVGHMNRMWMRLFLTILTGILAGQLCCQVPQFEDHSIAAGLLGNYLNHTASVADYDLDGDLDVYIGSRLAPNALYRNDGGAQFTAVEVGVEDPGFTMASLFFDYDNDGDPDLLSCNLSEANRFWRNDGGDFTEISGDLWPATAHQCRSAHAADVNQDGWLDLYVVNMNEANELWMGDGNGGYTDGYAASGAVDELVGMGALFFDIENDGDLDLYLTHDANQANKLYINDGTGTFDEQAAEWGLNLEAQGMGVDATDLNHDGYMDLFISNNLPNDLFLSPGPQPDTGSILPYTNVTETAGVGDVGMGWGTVFIDFDHDGERDLYVSNEYLFSPLLNLMYRNNGDLSFTDVAQGTLLESPYSGYATVAADFDQNGTEDLLVVNPLSGVSPGCQLFLNQDTVHHWIGFELEGVVSPRDAAGARVVVYSGSDFVRTDQSFLGNSYSSCGPMTFNFGLGERTQVDSVSFFWPSGVHTVAYGPEVDEYHTILESPCATEVPSLNWPESEEICPGEEVVLALPEGWVADSWTGGTPGPLGQVFGEAGVAQALLVSTNGCSVLSPNVVISVVEPVPPVVLLDGPASFCSAQTRALTIDHSALSVLWSTGATSDTLWMSSSDTINVTTTNLCGHIDTSEPVVLEVFASPLPPIVAPALIAVGEEHTFFPTLMEEAPLRWYSGGVASTLDALEATEVGAFLLEGDSFVTPPLAESTGWWVRSQAQRNVEVVSGGKETTSSGGFINSDSYGLKFDVFEPLVLETVNMRTASPGPRLVELSVPQLGVIDSAWVDLVEGWNTVALGFDLPVGSQYALSVSGEDISLWRDNVASELDYPYLLGDLAAITGSTIANSAELGYYYFFYDWVVRGKGLSCLSSPAAAWAEVVNVLTGCTYAFAANYNPSADLDDGSCVLAGCLNPEAANYQPLATLDDGSCTVLCESDVNGDGLVGAPDLLFLLADWGSSCE